MHDCSYSICNQPHPAPSLRAYSLQTTQLPRHLYLRALIKTSGSTKFSHLLSMFSTQPYHQHNCNYSLIIMYGPSRLGGSLPPAAQSVFLPIILQYMCTLTSGCQKCNGCWCCNNMYGRHACMCGEATLAPHMHVRMAGTSHALAATPVGESACHCVYVAHPLPVATQATVAGPQPQHLFNQMGPNQPTGVGCAYCTRKPCMLFTHALNGCVQCDMYNGAKFGRTQTAHSFPLCLQLHWCMYQPLCRLVSFVGYSLHACISTVFPMSTAEQQIAKVLHSLS
jgi:hypothetical protein